MNLTQRARAEALRFSSTPGEWGAAVLFEAPGGEQVTINCRVNEHYLGIESDGTPVSSKQASVCFSELAFANSGYPLRDVNGNVNMDNHRVSWVSATGATKKYTIRECFPDSTLGYIACTLTDFE